MRLKYIILAKLKRKRLSRHMDQGLFYENMGLGKIDDALLEFRRVLYLEGMREMSGYVEVEQYIDLFHLHQQGRRRKRREIPL